HKQLPSKSCKRGTSCNDSHSHLMRTGGVSMLGARKWTVSAACVLLAAVVLVLAVPHSGMAQVLYGSIIGDLKDSTGASLPGANVVVTNKGTGLTRETVSDATGHYVLPDLPAGTYGIKVSQQGFKAFEQTAVTVGVNSVSRVDVTLEVGNIGE